MADEPLVLTATQRDEILKAVAAIWRQLGHGAFKPETVWMIGLNLTIIQSTMGAPKTSWN